MKASELYAVWVENGLTPTHLRFNLLYLELFGEIYKGKYYVGRGDHEIDATPELLSLSEDFERAPLKYFCRHRNDGSDTSACTSCNRGERFSVDWAYGHRPEWWVCKQCLTVIPCPCEEPDESGRCLTCALPMSELAIARYNEKKALRHADLCTWKRTRAEREEEEKHGGIVCSDTSKIVMGTRADLRPAGKVESSVENS